MTPADWSVALALGAASSLHCAGMCGPIVVAYSANLPSRRLLPHAAYNLGRIATYMMLGAVAGLAGQGAGWLGHMAGVERWLAVAGGALLVVAGLFLLRPGFDAPLVRVGGRSPVQQILSKVGPVLLAADSFSKFRLGLALGFLPCGMVYAALAKAATTAGALDGAATMAAFGAGTATSLLAIALVSTGLRQRFSRYGTRLAAISVIVIGLVTVWRGANAMAANSPGEVACHGQHGS